MDESRKDKLLSQYYDNDAANLHKIVDKILYKYNSACKYTGLSEKDKDEFYSIANEVFVDALKRYDDKQSFDGFLYRCLSNKIKSYITSRNRVKRAADRNAISMDMLVYDTDNLTVGDTIKSDFDMDTVLEERTGNYYNENVEKYLNQLSKIQQRIIKMKMNDTPTSKIKEKLGLSDKQYNQHCEELKSFANINILFKNENIIEPEEDLKMSKTTMEKSKDNKLSIASIIKKMDKQTIRFNHPLQRESEQWSPAMKGNFISDILQGNPIPALVFAEQVINGISIIWDLDGKQRCTNAYSFCKDGYKISKNIKRFMIEYQAPVTDENGCAIFDENEFPVYESKIFDIRGKKFSDLPEELQERFNDYSFGIVQYLNCSSEDIAYHIARYNEGKPMTPSQKGITRLKEEYAMMVKSISNMSFFKDMGGYKVSEFKNGTINRVIVESIMAVNFLENWKKKQEDMCEYLKINASSANFDNFEDMVTRLERVVTDETSDMFDSKNSFLWFGLFSRFIKTETDDNKFIEFMIEFNKTLHSKKIDGVSFDDLNSKSSKDKKVVIAKMNLLEKLMYEFLNVNKEDIVVDDVLSFIKENVKADITEDDVEFYEDCLNDFTLNVDNNTQLLDEQNHPSLAAIIGYAFCKDIYIDDWFVDYFSRNNDYIRNQKENYLHMVRDLHKYITNVSKESA